jgi:hypothetical protein
MTTYTNQASVTLQALYVNGVLSIQEGDCTDNITEGVVTVVTVTITPPAGHEIEVTTSGSPSATWTEGSTGNWSTTLTVPAIPTGEPDEEETWAYTVILDDGTRHDPTFKITTTKR